MSEPWQQEESEDEEAMPAPEEPERQSDMAVVESDDDWED
jgi:hypothetical protein